MKDLPRRTDLRDRSALHHANARPERYRLLVLVRHVDHRHAVPVEPPQQRAHTRTGGHIERGERFVEEQAGRFGDERPRERHPLRLAARERTGFPSEEPHYLELARHRADAFGGGPARDATAPQAVLDIAPYRHMREERLVLEHEPDTPFLYFFVRDIPSLEQDAALIDGQYAGYRLEQDRLADPGGAEENEILARGHIEGDAADRKISEPLG